MDDLKKEAEALIEKIVTEQLSYDEFVEAATLLFQLQDEIDRLTK